MALVVVSTPDIGVGMNHNIDVYSRTTIKNPRRGGGFLYP